MAKIVTSFLVVTIYSNLGLRQEGLLRALPLEEVGLVILGMLVGITDREMPSAPGKG
jgi:hypothetical protein